MLHEAVAISTGCVQDATPTINATGVCTSGTHPYIQNTYDTSILGGTDFPIGNLTQSVATTYFPDGSSATTTEQVRYDQRSRTTEGKLAISVPGAWNVTAGIPTYQQDQTYNDANQNVTNTFTNTTGDSSTTTQVYDSSTGISTGLSNNATATADLATISYNSQGLLGGLNFLSTTGSQLASEQFGYDANFRPISANAVWQAGSGTSGTIANQSRTYDPNGNVTSLSITQATVPGAISSGGTETQNFCYDEQDRLVWSGNGGTQPGAGSGVCGTGTLNNTLSGAGYTNSFVYTHLGQIWQAPLNGGTQQYQYLYCDTTHPHQLTGVYQAGTTCATKSTSNQVYTSSDDAWGNVTSRWAFGSTSTLSYNTLDQMTEWTSGSNTEFYVYDALGQRVLRRSTNNGTTQLYTYPFGIFDFTYNSAGGKTSSTFYYSLGGTLIGTLSGGVTSFLMIDGLGSPLANISSTAGSAAVLGNQGYGPYGTRRYQQGTLGTSKGFTGQYADDLSGLDYYVSRYYDPVVGRFLSADTVQGNLAGMDPYGYVNGNPETKNDPTGKFIVGANGQGYRQKPNTSPTSPGAWVPFQQDTQDWSPLPAQTNSSSSSSGSSLNRGGLYPYLAWKTYRSRLSTSVKNYHGPSSLLNQFIAWQLASELPAAREQDPLDKSDGYNLADAFYYIVGPDGNLTGQMGFLTDAPVKGSDRYGGHSEDKLMNNVDNLTDDLVAQRLAGGSNQCPFGSRAVVVLFTQRVPCAICQAALRLQTASSNDKLTSVNMNLSLSVWTTNNQKRPGVFRGGYIEHREDIYEFMYLDENTPIW